MTTYADKFIPPFKPTKFLVLVGEKRYEHTDLVSAKAQFDMFQGVPGSTYCNEFGVQLVQVLADSAIDLNDSGQSQLNCGEPMPVVPGTTVVVADSRRAEAKSYIDQNVWNGEDRSGCKNDRASFDPDDLQGLVDGLVEHLTGVFSEAFAQVSVSGDGLAKGPGTNNGHGHVWERPDGMKARCGGPGFCSQCAADEGKYGQAMDSRG